jgi:hypothetical protein
VGDALSVRYGVTLSGPALNYYRDGRDSVAPHADRELRDLDDTIVAILTLGARRPFLLRPRAGGPSIDVAPASGDLLVMGGRCQREWQHAVPKVRRAGPRISASWRAPQPSAPTDSDVREALPSHRRRREPPHLFRDAGADPLRHTVVGLEGRDL